MFGRLKKKKNKTPIEAFSSLTANGVNVEAINVSLHNDKEGTPHLEIRTPDVCEALHYDEVDFVLKTNLKQIDVKGKFKEAINEKHFKLYIFDVEDYNLYYI